MEPIKIHMNWPFTKDLVEKVRQVSHRLEVTVDREAAPGRAFPVPTGAEILYVSYMLPDPSEVSNVKWVQTHSAGVDRHMEHAVFKDKNIVFTSTSGIHGVPMAEYAVGQMLHHSKQMPTTLRNQADMLWPANRERWNIYGGAELRGQTLGIIGYGSIGREIARLANALGMTVLALKRDLQNLAFSTYVLDNGTGDPDGDIPERFYPPEALHSFLNMCDFVVVAVPLNEDTYHLIDEAAFEAMKPSACFINIARGAIVDEPALVDALDHGEIASASLDVFEDEPLSSDNPLWEMPNVVVTPHISGLSNRYDERAIDLFCENVRRYLSGAPLLNHIDKTLGY